MKTLTLSVRTHITHERVANLLDGCAYGSSYWCQWAGDLAYEKTTTDLLENGKTLELRDFEDEKARYTLNYAKIKKGLTVMAKKFPKHFADFLTENEDAITSDVFLQCALFGNIIYS